MCIEIVLFSSFEIKLISYRPWELTSLYYLIKYADMVNLIILLNDNFEEYHFK